MHPGELFKYLCCYCCSVTNWCPALCDPVGCSTPGFPVLHYFQEFAQIHVYWVGDSKHLFLCHLLLFLPQPFQASGCFSVSQLFMSGGQSIGVSASASVLPMNIQDWLPLGLTGSTCSSRDSQESSQAPQFKNINSSTLSLLYGPTLTSIHDSWKNHSFDYVDLCQQSDVSAF